MFIKSKDKGARGSLRNAVALNTEFAQEILFTIIDSNLILIEKGLILLDITIYCG